MLQRSIIFGRISANYVSIAARLAAHANWRLTMRKVILAALTVLSLGAGVASAATPSTGHNVAQTGNNYNFLQGGD